MYQVALPISTPIEPLTPEIAKDLMWRSMTTGVPASEFDKYGGSQAVSSLYTSSGGEFGLSTIPTENLNKYAQQIADTGVGNLSILKETNTPLSSQAVANMKANGLEQSVIDQAINYYQTPIYDQIVQNAYGGIGQFGFGSGIGNIDQQSFDYWKNQLATGAISPSQFQSVFNNSVNQYLSQSPDSKYTQYGLNLVSQTDPLRSTFENVYQDQQIDWNEAQQIQEYADKYNFKPEDIARVTGVPIEKVNQLLNAREQMLESAFQNNQFQDPLALVRFMQANNLSAKQMIDASGGKITQDQIDSYEKDLGVLGSYLNTGVTDDPKSLKSLADKINADPTLRAKYGNFADSINSVEDTLKFARQYGDFANGTPDSVYQTLLGLNEDAVNSVPKQIDLKNASSIAVGFGEDGRPSGFAIKVDDPTFNKIGQGLYANYDENGKLIGFNQPSEASRINLAPDTFVRYASWDANGNSLASQNVQVNRGDSFGNFLADLGPLPSIGLAIATSGASLEAQIAAQAALQVASGVPLDKAVTNAAAMYAGSQVVNIPAIKDAVGGLDSAALQNVAKGALSGATTAGVLGKDIGTGALTGGTGAAVGNVVSNIAADQGLTPKQTNVLNASASVFARSMLAGATLEQAFQAAAMAGGMANAKSVVKGLKADKSAGIDIPDDFINKVESGGIKLASADGSLPIEIGGVPIYAESSKASTVEPPFGYRLLSTQEADSKPQGSYYDITQNAWMAPDEEQMRGLADLQSGLASGSYAGNIAQGAPSGLGYGNTAQGVPSGSSSDYGTINVTAPRDAEIPEIVITDTREPAAVDATPVATQPPSTSTKSPTSPTSPLSKLATSGGGMPSVAGAASLTGYIPPALKESLIKTKITGGKFQDPLKHLKDIQEAQLATEQNMIQNGIDPQLAAILAARAVQSVDQPQTPHFTYGQEDSIDSILGSTDAGALDQAYAEGGYVQPLTLAPGGLAAPLMAATGGLPSKRKGREDFRTSKHVAGEGDGHSDDIPAMLADGEFVFSADVVSALGNGSTKAGSDKLYKMVEEIRKRARSTSPDKLAPPALKSPLDYLKKR